MCLGIVQLLRITEFTHFRGSGEYLHLYICLVVNEL